MGKNIRSSAFTVMNVMFLDVVTKKPVLYFDTLKTSSIENTSQKQEIRGGQGNKKLASFQYGREAVLKMQDALISDMSLALLSGTSVQDTGLTVWARETVVVDATKKVSLSQTPLANTWTVNKVTGEEVTGGTLSGKDISLTAGSPTVAQGDSVVVVYQYTSTSSDQAKIVFNAEKFPQEFTVVGDCVLNGDNGVPYKAQFYISKAKLQPDFTFTLEAENPSTFDFTLDILADAGNGDLYSITRY